MHTPISYFAFGCPVLDYRVCYWGGAGTWLDKSTITFNIQQVSTSTLGVASLTLYKHTNKNTPDFLVISIPRQTNTNVSEL